MVHSLGDWSLNYPRQTWTLTRQRSSIEKCGYRVYWVSVLPNSFDQHPSLKRHHTISLPREYSSNNWIESLDVHWCRKLRHIFMQWFRHGKSNYWNIAALTAFLNVIRYYYYYVLYIIILYSFHSTTNANNDLQCSNSDLYPVSDT
jgi:hypothetical protein